MNFFVALCLYLSVGFILAHNRKYDIAVECDPDDFSSTVRRVFYWGVTWPFWAFKKSA